MIDLVLGTRNRDKVRELAHSLLGCPVRLISVGELGDWPEVEETGETLEENSLLKARDAARRSGRLSLGDDTGLEVDALGGAPGVRSSRYAGEGVTYAENVAKLLQDLRDVPAERRTARFRCVAALVEPGGREACVEGVVEGRILDRRRGEGGFGYDPVFLAAETGLTFAEMGLEEKDAISHRGRALRAVREVLASWYGWQ